MEERVSNGRYVDVQGIAAHLGTSQRHIRCLVASNRIPYYKVGRLLRFKPAEVDASLEHKAVAP